MTDYNNALKYLNMALTIGKRKGDEKQLTDCYKNMGIKYYSQGMLSKAHDFYYGELLVAVKNHYDSSTTEIYDDMCCSPEYGSTF